jgi:hypothetical protein
MQRPDATITDDDVRTFVEEVLRTGLMLTDLLAGLIESLPEDAFPGEDGGEVLLEMLVGTLTPVAEAAGARTVRQTTALLGAVCDRTIADLRATLERAGEP